MLGLLLPKFVLFAIYRALRIFHDDDDHDDEFHDCTVRSPVAHRTDVGLHIIVGLLTIVEHEGPTGAETHPEDKSQEQGHREAYLVVEGALTGHENGDEGNDDDVDFN